jgi:hypothetical protein
MSKRYIAMGSVLRYARPYSADSASIDGLPNFFYYTHSPGMSLATLERGINPIASPKGQSRVPAILVSSSPHKVGSIETPWQDTFSPDVGHIRYYGDNKAPGFNPTMARGNASLIDEFALHHSEDPAMRARAAPVLFFHRVRVENRSKGNVRFQGFGIVERVERVVQFDAARGQTFPNYVFDFAVLSLFDESELFNWDWISARRDRDLSDKQTLAYAPEAWKIFVSDGIGAIRHLRRRVSKILIVPSDNQRPPEGSREERTLNSIYHFYAGRKSRFEAVAEFVTRRILSRNGSYRTGWITPPSSDGGADFVARLDRGN